MKRKLKHLGDCVLPTSGDSLEDVEPPPVVGEELFMRIQDHVAMLIVSLSAMHMQYSAEKYDLALTDHISEHFNVVQMLGNLMTQLKFIPY